MAKKNPMVKKKLPEFIFVHWEGSDPVYLSSDEKPENAVDELGQAHRVGRYKLVDLMEVRGDVKVIHFPTRIGPSKKKKRN